MKNAEQKRTKYCFRQEAGSNVHKLYIYDDVSEYGTFDWQTWEYSESETSAKFFQKALEEIPETDTIELHINSYGGSVKEGVAIYSQLRRKKCKEIVAYVDGFAYSIASVILQAADRRIMGLGTSLLIHNMWMEVAGNADDLRKAADDLDVLMESNRQIYLEKINISEEELIDMMNAETFLTPEQAVEMGFADEIDSDKQVDENKTVEAMQKQISQMRRMLTDQKAFKAEMQRLFKNLRKEDDEDEDDEEGDSTDDTDGEDDSTDDTDDESTDDTEGEDDGNDDDSVDGNTDDDAEDTDDSTDDADDTDDSTDDADDTDDSTDDTDGEDDNADDTDGEDDGTDDDNTDNTDDNADSEDDDDEKKKQKGTKRDPKNRSNKLAALLARAAAQNLKKER